MSINGWRKHRMGMMVLTGAISKELIKIQSQEMEIQFKQDFRDLVTKGDKFVSRAIVPYLRETFPGDGISSEEGIKIDSTSGYEISVDEIDGTNNFAEGLPLYGISIGRIKDGRSEEGALAFPALGQYLFAVRGHGAWRWDPARERFAALVQHPRHREKEELSEAIVALDLAPEYRYLYVPFREQCRDVRMFGSFIHATALVAKGQLSAYVCLKAKPDDMPAALLIAEEMGCAASRVDGGPIDVREHTPFVVAANRTLLEKICAACNI